MLNMGYEEQTTRGTVSFPIEYHHVDKKHPRYQMPLHWHIDFEIIRVLSGEFLLTLDTETVLLTEGDAILLHGGVLHGGVPKDCVYECLVFDLGYFLRTSPLYQKELDPLQNQQFQKESIVKEDSEEGALLKKLFSAMIAHEKGCEWQITGLLFELFAFLQRNERHEELLPTATRDMRRIQQIKRVLSLIRKEYASPLTLEELAEASGMSPKYFCRFFSSMTGKTPIDYLNYYRVECAADHLLYSEESVTDIALSCGFNDLSYFVKTFKRYKGMTPKQFRKGQTHEAE